MKRRVLWYVATAIAVLVTSSCASGGEVGQSPTVTRVPPSPTDTPTATPRLSRADERATVFARATAIKATYLAGKPTPTPTATLSQADVLATMLAPTPTPTSVPTPTVYPPMFTPRPTPTSVAGPVPYPVIDLNVDLPYLQDGGAVPPGALTRIGIGIIREADFYPDRAYLMLGTSTGMYVYDPVSFERHWRRYLGRSPWDISLSEDGSHIVIGYGWDAAPILFDAATGNRVATLDGWHTGYWSPDGSMLAVEEKPDSFNLDEPELMGRIWLYDGVTGTRLRSLEAEVVGFFGSVFSVKRWSPDGAYIAACGDNGIYVWDTGTADLLHTVSVSTLGGGLYQRNCSLEFSTDSAYLAGNDSDCLSVLDLATGDIVMKTPDYVDYGWLPGKLYLIGKRNITVFDTTTWSEVHSGAGVNVSEAAMSPSGQQIAVATYHGVTVLNADSFEVEYTLDLPARWVDWSPGGTWLVAVGEDAHTIFDGASGEQACNALNPTDGMLFADEQHLLVIDGHQVMLFDLLTGKMVSGTRVGVVVEQMAWSLDGSTLVLSGAGRSWYWSEETGRLESTLPAGLESGPAVRALAEIWRTDSISPDGTLRAKASNEGGCGYGPFGSGCGVWSGTINVYELLPEGEMRTIVDLAFTGSGVTAMAWSPDSTMLAIGHGGTDSTLHNSRIQVLDPRTGKELFAFEGHLDYVTALIFSPDGTRLASAAEDGTVVVWNTAR
jgi:WD40 repeat protein